MTKTSIPSLSSNASPPRHVAIIMDGNGRWAAARGLPRTMGHKAGIDAVQRTLGAARDAGVHCLTLYSFSTENWQRPRQEVTELMRLLRFYLRSELATLHREGVHLRVIGERHELPADVGEMIAHAEELTRNNARFTLVLALSYGGRQEITAAARGIAAAVARGELRPEAIDYHLVQSFLFTGGLPDPDLIIRTSGEKRLSNFLLWQAAYAEFVFQDVLWPDYDAEAFQAALTEYASRTRRYGLTTEKRQKH